jgi:hypothetical protein
MISIRLLKNWILISVLKGRGFKPRRKSHRITAALAAAGTLAPSEQTFHLPATAQAV